MPKIINDPTNKILKSAVDVIRKVGRDNLSMRQVAKKANISVGTIYNYYPDKESLLSAIDKKQGEIVRKEIAAYKGKDKPVEEVLGELYEKAVSALSLEEEKDLVAEALAKALAGSLKKEDLDKEVYAIVADAMVEGIKKNRKKETLLLVLKAPLC